MCRPGAHFRRDAYMKIDSAVQEQLDAFRGMERAVMPRFRNSVTPIGAYWSDHARQHATGTFFQVAERSFLVSAAHVFFDEKKQRAIPNLCVFDPVTEQDGKTRLQDVP